MNTLSAADLQSLKARLEKLEDIILNANAPVTHQLAESVDGVVGLKEAIWTKPAVLRWLWAFLFFAGSGGTVYFIYATIDGYLAYPIKTNVQLRHSDEYEYPPITLCNGAWFDTEKALSMGLSMDAFKYSLGYRQPSRLLTIKFSNTISAARQEFFKFFNDSNFTTLVQYYRAISTDIQPAYSKEEFYDKNEPTYFAEPGRAEPQKSFIPIHIMCYTFLLKPIKAKLGVLFEPEKIRLKFTDKTGGLKRVSQNWYLFTSADASTWYTVPLIIPFGTNSLVKIKAQKFISLNRRKWPCTSGRSSHGHNSANCMVDCESKLQKDSYGCMAFWKSTDNHKKSTPADFCNLFDHWVEDLSALASNISQWEETAVNNASAACYDQCPHRCESMMYDASYEGSDEQISLFYGPEETNRMKGSNFTVTDIHITHAAMYQFGIITIEEELSYSFVNLVNNVGGTLGLFIGGTLMTVPQFLLFFVSYFCKRNGRNSGHGNTVGSSELRK